MIKKVLIYLFLLIILISCSKRQTTVPSVFEENRNEGKVEKRIATNEDNELNLKTFYHAESNEVDGINCKVFDQNWVKISAFRDLSIANFQKELMGNDLKVILTNDYNNDGVTEKVLTGVYLNSNNEEGVFITVLSKTNVLFVQSYPINPILLHLRDNKPYIYFGTGFGGSYTNGIEFKNNKIEIIEMED